MDALRTLSGMGPSPRRLAAALSARAPRGHMLAFISPREAQVLRARGGSGAPDPETGIHRFDNEFDSQQPSEAPPPPPIIPEGGGSVSDYPGGGQFGFDLNQPGYAGGYNFAPPDFGGAPQGNSGATDFVAPPPASTGSAAQFQPTGFDPNSPAPGGYVPPPGTDMSGGAPAPDNAGVKAFADQGQQAPVAPGGNSLFKGLDLGKLAMAGVTGLMGARTARNAAAQGQQAKTEQKQVAAPYQQLGTNLQAQAQRGELSASGQQALQAMRAQIAQSATNRGGVGVAQAENQIAALRQKLLEEQMQLGLKISGIGDQIALGAIQTGIQADRYVNDLTQSYFTNIARTLYGNGTPAAPPPTPAPGTP